ncbi:unnamed protein product [Cyclocybe aegerita]|uniref:Uncharacterized protein n=1 Tax=Cyclocybe aegerita TaxID=1973307 RepID=A0A8S0XK84_CYCAE|nr:unnamed protein product [Cyclocybe aegerita]
MSTNRGQGLSFSPLSEAVPTLPALQASVTTDEHLTFGDPEPERHQLNFHFKASKFSASTPEACATCDNGIQKDLGTVERADFVGGEFSGPEELNPTTSPLSVTKAEAPP